MTTSGIKGFDAMCFLPLSSQRLQEHVIAQLKEKVQELEEGAHSAVTSSQSAEELDGEGMGASGVPQDILGQNPKRNMRDGDSVPDSVVAADKEREESLSKKWKKRKADQDGDMPSTIPHAIAVEKPNLLQKIVAGATAAAQAAGPYVRTGLELANYMRGGEEQETMQGGEKEEMSNRSTAYPPYYVGFHYRKKVDVD